MVAPALLAGGNMGSGGASLILICAGREEGVVKRTGGVGEAALTSGGVVGLMALMMTRMGSRSGAWTMRMKKWAPSMPLGPSCLSRYLRQGKTDQRFVECLLSPSPSPFPLCALCPSLHRRVPRSPFLRSRSSISRAWRKRRKSLWKDWMGRALRQVSPQGLAEGRPESLGLGQMGSGVLDWAGYWLSTYL
jgi:hypothetical protein